MVYNEHIQRKQIFLPKERKVSIMNFNKAGFEAFRADLKNALKEVEEKHGISIDFGRISYTDYEFTMPLTAIRSDGNTDGKRMLFEQYCKLYGFAKEDYEREFTSDQKQFKLVGFNTRSPKNCCEIYCITNGKTYKCSADTVKHAFAAQK